MVVVNTSPSVAPGLYVRMWSEPEVGELVSFAVPPAARGYIRARTGRSGEGWHIIKPVAAGPGDRVDATGDRLVINGVSVAPMPPPFDGAGRPLSVWREDRVLGPGEFFVLSTRIPNSLDSRIYGPIPREQIEAVRRPLVRW